MAFYKCGVNSNLIDKEITSNGTYDPARDNADGYSSVKVDVDPESIEAPDAKFTVNFYIGEDLSLSVPNVPYGGFAEYPNASLIGTDPNYGDFYGWNPTPNNVRRNMNCYARFSQEARPIQVNEIYKPWEDIIADKGLNIPVGAYRALHLGTVNDVYYGSIMMQKVYEGESDSTSTWLSMQCPGVAKYFDRTDPNNDWDVCELRTFLNEEFFNTVIPKVLKNAIVPVTKFSRKTGTSGENISTIDSIWIPSAREIGIATDTAGPIYKDIFEVSQTATNTRKRYQINDSTTYVKYITRSGNSNAVGDGIGINTDGSVNWNVRRNDLLYFVFGFCL